jgi:hypothetical protein
MDLTLAITLTHWRCRVSASHFHNMHAWSTSQQKPPENRHKFELYSIFFRTTVVPHQLSRKAEPGTTINPAAAYVDVVIFFHLCMQPLSHMSRKPETPKVTTPATAQKQHLGEAGQAAAL